MHLRFEPRYAALTGLVLVIELLVGTVFRHHPFIRGSLGDLLATPFVFFGLLTVVRVSHLRAAMASFCLACVIELGQLFHLADRLGFRRGSFFSIVLGSSFSWEDIGWYALGAGAALYISICRVKERLKGS